MMDTRELIIEKSRELFFKKGYSKTSLSEIAVECGISKGGLYHHYERKEDLFIESIISIFIENERIILSSIEKEFSIFTYFCKIRVSTGCFVYL